MANAVRDDMKELYAIEAELKQVNAKARQLRARKKELTNRILEHLDETDGPGYQYHELQVVRKPGTTHSRLKKGEKKNNIIQALEESGISEPEKVYEAITNASKGEAKEQSKLVVKMGLPVIDG
jgi:predicted transcriptional regulator